MFTLMSCGRGVQLPAVDHGPFTAYFEQFEGYSKSNGRETLGDNSLSIGFAKLNGAEAGRCEWHFLHGRKVLLDPEKWDVLDDASREALLLHELGHCLLHREHVQGDARIPDLRAASEKQPGDNEHEFTGPKSLMNPTSVAGSVYLRNRDYYVKELFGKQG